MQTLLADAVDALAARWPCAVDVQRSCPVVATGPSLRCTPTPGRAARSTSTPVRIGSIVLRPVDCTLTDDQANALRDRVYAALRHGPVMEWAIPTRCVARG